MKEGSRRGFQYRRQAEDHFGVRGKKHRNYITKKNRRNDPDRLELKKFCPNCGKHQPHKESR